MSTVVEAEDAGATVDELREILGKGKAKKGIFEGDIVNGELEIGQVASLFKGRSIEPVEAVMQELVSEYFATRNQFQ
jgi:enoyl-[acyl-carrier protein] reductase II